MIPISKLFLKKSDLKYLEKVLNNRILTDDFFQKIVRLPIFPDMSKTNQHKIINKLHTFSNA